MRLTHGHRRIGSRVALSATGCERATGDARESTQPCARATRCWRLRASWRPGGEDTPARGCRTTAANTATRLIDGRLPPNTAIKGQSLGPYALHANSKVDHPNLLGATISSVSRCAPHRARANRCHLRCRSASRPPPTHLHRTTRRAAPMRLAREGCVASRIFCAPATRTTLWRCAFKRVSSQNQPLML